MKKRFFFLQPVQAEYASLTKTLVSDNHLISNGYVAFRDTETGLCVPLTNIQHWIDEPEVDDVGAG